MMHRDPLIAAFMHLSRRLGRAVQRKERIASESRGRTGPQFDRALSEVQEAEQEVKRCFRLVQQPDGMETGR